MSTTTLCPTLRAMTIAVVLGASVLPAAPSRAQNLCELYVVQQGDTLSTIASRAGIEGGFQFLFSANRDLLGSVGALTVGATIRIPCADGSLPEGAVPAAAPEAVPATPELVAAPLPQVRFLTGGRYPPFTDESLAEGGLVTEMIRTAMSSAAPDQDFRIDFVNDWSSHLTALLPSGAFDLGFPWHLPDCSRIDRLSPTNAARCTDFDASLPIFESVVGYYTLKDSPEAGATDHSQLAGTRLCRPRDWFDFDLETAGLTEPTVTLVEGRNQKACWDALVAGEVDVVTFDALPAEADINRYGLTDRVVNIAPLSTLATMHVFAPKSNPNGRILLDEINAGLTRMRGDGRWFAIVARQLSAYDAGAAN